MNRAVMGILLAGIATLGGTVALSTPASAHYLSTRCDRDGDDCYRVVCDDDGDDCRTVGHFHRDYRPSWGMYSYPGNSGIYFGGPGIYGRPYGYGYGYGDSWRRGEDDDDD